MSFKKILLASALATTFTTAVQAADAPAAPAATAMAKPVFMSGDWAKQACDAWNKDPVLTGQLQKWVKNHSDKGYKVMQIYREDCASSPRVEMQIKEQDGKAMCVYGGITKTAAKDINSRYDYVMYAKDKHWVRMGDGSDSPMKAMMLGRLNFDGPSFEAMKNMGPFKSFLLLTGKVDSDRSKCPQAEAAAAMK